MTKILGSSRHWSCQFTRIDH